MFVTYCCAILTRLEIVCLCDDGLGGDFVESDFFCFNGDDAVEFNGGLAWRHKYVSYGKGIRNVCVSVECHL